MAKNGEFLYGYFGPGEPPLSPFCIVNLGPVIENLKNQVAKKDQFSSYQPPLSPFFAIAISFLY